MPLILGANSVSGGYEIDNSLRFNSASSDSLTRTPASTTNRKTFTISTWFKRSTITQTQFLFGTTDDNFVNSFFLLELKSTDFLDMTNYASGINLRFITNQLIRDPSAWYHLIFACDTTQATESNRVKIYLNGSQITSFSTATYPTQNLDTLVNLSTHENSFSGGSFKYNGYIAESYLIDGQALDPTDFGEFDQDSGIWKPIPYTSTFGTNGFYLDFEDSANLGNDMSGNNNDFTVNNLTSIDQTTDTPTNNFCLHNPLDKTSEGNFVLTEGNTKGTGTTGTQISKSTFYLDKGKWYWECKPTTIPSEFQIGVAQQNYTAGTGDRRTYVSTGQKSNNTKTSYGSSYTTNDIIGVALDLDNGTIGFYKNGVSQGTAYSDLLSGVTLTGWTPLSLGDEGAVFSVNFGNPNYSANAYQDANGFGNFSYSVPSGFYSLNTRNLAQFG